MMQINNQCCCAYDEPDNTCAPCKANDHAACTDLLLNQRRRTQVMAEARRLSNHRENFTVTFLVKMIGTGVITILGSYLIVGPMQDVAFWFGVLLIVCAIASVLAGATSKLK